MKRFLLAAILSLVPVISFAQQIGPSYGAPSAYQAINLFVEGACGIPDGTTILNAAFATAAITGQAVYHPGGCTINHKYETTNTDLTLNGIEYYGDGLTSVLNSTTTTASDPHNVLYIQGNGTRI